VKFHLKRGVKEVNEQTKNARVTEVIVARIN